ncbi:MAG: family transcriptional regulator, cyclic receptor protein [Chthoniobacter sp.]|jgi:CRP-like cAMP-binding protein|nr:family transcriptional regulator, cyclic receptor protein [Chthoniobacter sp.]
MDSNLLRTVSFLRSLTDEELAAFDALLTIREFKARERIIEEGTPVFAIYLVCDGIVHVRRLGKGREILLGRLGVGGFFGEINLFDPGIATASIYAMKATRIACVEYEPLRTFMASHPATGYKMVSAMMTEMSRRLRQISGRLVNMAYWSSSEASLSKPEAS